MFFDYPIRFCFFFYIFSFSYFLEYMQKHPSENANIDFQKNKNLKQNEETTTKKNQKKRKFEDFIDNKRISFCPFV